MFTLFYNFGDLSSKNQLPYKAELRQLGSMKRSLFKATMVDLMREQFGVCLRRDVADERGKQQEAWKGVRLLNTEVLAA